MADKLNGCIFDWRWWIITKTYYLGYSQRWCKKESLYNKEFLKTKIKHNDDEVTQFNNKEILKVGSDHTC